MSTGEGLEPSTQVTPLLFAATPWKDILSQGLEMSVRTQADEYRDAAKEAVESAIKNLSELVVNQCSGVEEYSEGYREELKETFSTLIDMRDNF